MSQEKLQQLHDSIHRTMDAMNTTGQPGMPNGWTGPFWGQGMNFNPTTNTVPSIEQGCQPGFTGTPMGTTNCAPGTYPGSWGFGTVPGSNPNYVPFGYAPSWGCPPTSGYSQANYGPPPTWGTGPSYGYGPNYGMNPTCGTNSTFGWNPAYGINPPSTGGFNPNFGFNPVGGVNTPSWGTNMVGWGYHSPWGGPQAYPGNFANYGTFWNPGCSIPGTYGTGWNVPPSGMNSWGNTNPMTTPSSQQMAA